MVVPRIEDGCVRPDLANRRCCLRLADGMDHDTCDEPAVVMFNGTPICRSCAEEIISHQTRQLAAVREALR
jgi:hypothetical protein